MKKVLCSALVAIMLLCMTACGNNLAGHYNFYSMNMEGMEVTADALGGEVEMYIELEKDGTGTMAAMGEVVEMGWADGEIWPIEDPTDKAPFTVDGDTLTIELEGIKMIFKK